MKLGRLFLVTVAFCLSLVASAAVPRYTVRIEKVYPHDAGAYTQGLFFNGGRLFESTGQWGESSLREIELKSGKVLRRANFSRKYFAEGSVILDGKLYVLTWTDKVAFVYDPGDFSCRQTWTYPREGWGLTTDGKSLIASDGSSKLYFMDGSFKLNRTLEVTLNGKPVRYLNELEWIEGRIWANVYTTDMIVIINPQNGIVDALVDCRGLYAGREKDRKADVLNGIACGPDGKIYLTGKYWPHLYEVSLVGQGRQ